MHEWLCWPSSYLLSLYVFVYSEEDVQGGLETAIIGVPFARVTWKLLM